MHLTSLFDLSLLGRADRAALEYADASGALRTSTFGQVEARANRMAHELSARGLSKGDRLCVHLPNSVAFIDLFLACVRLGVVFVPMNVLYKERELKHIIGDSDPRAVVTSTGSDAVYPENVVRWEVETLTENAGTRPTSRVLVPSNGDAPAMIVYTSGTTGTAKGAVLSHNNLAANGISLTTCWRITEADRYLAVLPLFHVHGLGNGIHTWLISGCRMRLAERFDQKSAGALFRDFAPTLFFGVPTIYVRLLESAVVPDRDAHAIGSRARLFVCGSAPLPAHVLEAFRHRFGHTILERYGMSESLMICSNPYEGDRRAGSVGPPLPGVSARIVDENDTEVADGAVGEVQVRGPALFSGYWRNAAATDAALTGEGWFRTGDLAVRSPDGYYTLRGRRGDMIISGGFNIYPREIEELLLEDPRVHEAAVVGAADAVRGEVPVAYIVAEQSLDVTELVARCRTQLASFKEPRAFVRVDALPRTALGKVQKHLLPPWSGTA
ncbi:MAG TPA: AMP-binding protein [Gemmatimonadaceae bacterium]|nr:AMP-binding protein [Gemmatimonadaceae bacterium]